MRYLILLFVIAFMETNAQPELKLNFTMKKFPTSSPNMVSFLEFPITPVITSTENRACVEFCLGTLPQCFHLVIQSNSFYIWVVDHYSNQKASKKFDASQSMTFVKNDTEVTMKYYKDHVYAYTARDDLTIQQVKIGRIFFGVSKNADSFTQYEGMIGLGYTPQSAEEKFSLIEQLYSQNIIFHKVFTQSFTTSDKGELSFGKIPKHIIEDYSNYGRCPALDKIKNGEKFKNSNWQCSITGFYFGNKYDAGKVKHLEDAKVSFFSYRKRALIPLDIFEYLESNYLNKYFDLTTCQRIKVKKYDTFSCKEDIINAEEINLIFGDWAMRIPGSELFKFNKNTEKYEFIFYHKNNYEKWTLGRPIVKNFHMVYDTQNEQIGFYSQTNVIHVSNSPVTPPITYEEIRDKEQKKKPDKNKPPKKKPPTLKPYPDNQNDIIVPKENSKALSTALVIQIFLLVFVIIVAVIFASFGIWMYIRYRRKTKFPNHEYFYKQAEELSRH